MRSREAPMSSLLTAVTRFAATIGLHPGSRAPPPSGRFELPYLKVTFSIDASILVDPRLMCSYLLRTVDRALPVTLWGGSGPGSE